MQLSPSNFPTLNEDDEGNEVEGIGVLREHTKTARRLFPLLREKAKVLGLQRAR